MRGAVRHRHLGAAAWKFGIPTSESHARSPGFRRRHRPPRRIRGHQPAEWSRCWSALCFPPFSVSSWASSAKTIERVCRNMDRQEDQQALQEFAALRRRVHGVYGTAPRTARSSPERIPARRFPFQRPGRRHHLSDPDLADDPLLCRHGSGHFHRRIPHHQIRRDGHVHLSPSGLRRTRARPCLLLSSLSGIPVSTTHTKTTAIMGVGASKRLSAVNWGIVKKMSLAWILTFPGCGL